MLLRVPISVACGLGRRDLPALRCVYALVRPDGSRTTATIAYGLNGHFGPRTRSRSPQATSGSSDESDRCEGFHPTTRRISTPGMTTNGASCALAKHRHTVGGDVGAGPRTAGDRSPEPTECGPRARIRRFCRFCRRARRRALACAAGHPLVLAGPTEQSAITIRTR